MITNNNATLTQSMDGRCLYLRIQYRRRPEPKCQIQTPHYELRNILILLNCLQLIDDRATELGRAPSACSLRAAEPRVAAVIMARATGTIAVTGPLAVVGALNAEVALPRVVLALGSEERSTRRRLDIVARCLLGVAAAGSTTGNRLSTVLEAPLGSIGGLLATGFLDVVGVLGIFVGPDVNVRTNRILEI